MNLAKQNYEFVFYSNVTKNPHVLWRHDVDFSIHRSLKLAEIEKNVGVYSIHFIRLHSEFYNIFEKEIFDRVNKIISFGHEIVLHFDYDFYEITNFLKLEEKLLFDKNIIEKLFSTKSMYFHFIIQKAKMH